MKLLFLCQLFLFSVILNAQVKLSHDDSLLIGTWKGTSICQVKSSPCKDEIAAYHITKNKQPNSYHMIMSKIVNGVEEEMGGSDYNFDADKGILTWINEQYKLLWTFNLKGDKMDGTLVLLDDQKTLYRIIKLTKAK